jgi:hypothetical protein
MLSRKVFVCEWEGGRAMLVLAETVVDHFETTDSCPCWTYIYHIYLCVRQATYVSLGAESADYMT